jgi:hypothetical protein
MLHTKTSGVDVDEALRCMSLLRQRLDQSGPSKINLLSALQSYLGAMLKGVVLSKKLASPECVRLFLTLPSFILQPLHPSLYAMFASALTTLPAEWRTLLGQHRT